MASMEDKFDVTVSSTSKEVVALIFGDIKKNFRLPFTKRTIADAFDLNEPFSILDEEGVIIDITTVTGGKSYKIDGTSKNRNGLSSDGNDNKRVKYGPFRNNDKYFSNSAFHMINTICPTELQKHKLEYKKTILERDFIAFTNNFMEALKTKLNNNSPFYSDPIFWTKREQSPIQRLIKYIYLLEQNEKHISSIFVGMKGVGKTTLVQKICITAGVLSDTLFITYFDITSNLLSPVDILNEALNTEGDMKRFNDIRDLLDYIRAQGRKLLTVIDEAQKYYAKRTDSEMKKESSTLIVGQIYELGIANGSCCILCGSSSKLVDIALQRSLTDTAKELLVQYESYPSLNHQKFTPIVLPLVELEDLPKYLQFLGLRFDKNAIYNYWVLSGGSLRYIIKNEELTSNISFQGPTYAILLWLYSQQDNKQDVMEIKKIPLTMFERQKKYWDDNEILFLPPSILYELIDDCLLSTTWNDSGLTYFGFGHPGQFLKLQLLDKIPGELTIEEKNWLLDPNKYGEKLEWLVQSCILKKSLSKKYVLCLNNKPSNIRDPHEDILLNNWKPLESHLNLVMKLSPDDFGIDMIQVVKVKENYELRQSQIKLGGSKMHIGKDHTVRDSVRHMIHRINKKATKVKDYLVERLPSEQRQMITTINFAYITRELTPTSRILITDSEIKLYDRNDMLLNVWSKAVIDYSKSVGLNG